LDLPEPELADDQPPPAYDDFEAEFTQAFGDMGDGAAAREAEKQAAQEADDRFFAEALGLSAAPAAAAAAPGFTSWQDAADATENAGPARTEDFERDYDVAEYAPPKARTAVGRPKGIFIVAA